MSESRRPERERLPLEMEQEIDRLSDEFERAWKAGNEPWIEDYIGRVAEVGRARLLEELLLVEFDLRQQADETIDIEFYHQRFSDNRTIIDAALAQHERRKQDRPPRIAGQLEGVAAEKDQPDPGQIGRFQIRRRLGKGGYGVVYLAHDPGLDRLVALKVPRLKLLKTGKQRENFLHEARTAAKLEHPALVPVYEVQQDGDLIYVVQKFIEGQNLAEWASDQARSWEDITRRMIEITGAIGYVHQQGFYHRDLKPGNILIDNAGQAHVADFGLAVHEDALRMLKGKAPGTPPYMSPEQIRGETHRIDNRTDIWALGVILYELLAGQRPFAADEPLDLYEEIQELDPKSPRMRNPEVPKELERICFKCLAKRRTQRYATASDLLEDLQAFLVAYGDAADVSGDRQNLTADRGSDPVAVGSATVRAVGDSTPQESTPTPDSGSQPPLRIVPKGLRSFDKEDKDFFLELLPGPRDREGLPDTIRFWKTRSEETDADATFPVGVMYGPSGCGKSSLVKAGLLPHLSLNVLPIFVEATPNDTELRLLKALRKHIPRLASEASLAEALAQLREGRIADGRKVLLVLDQFEQWLHSARDMDGSQLVRSLRQCDGANVQCLVLVRDDFWMSTTRFMKALEISQLEGVNSADVDLFDPSHARKVLRAFGLAYGRLPEHDLSADEQRFLDRAVQDLMHDGKVICVQLSLFADMMKGRPWTPASLQEVGGTSGVGVAFLEETFTAKIAPPTHRLHAKAAQAVLKALLPEVGTDIKGQMQPTERLLECSGYSTRPDDFRDLLQILNSELRLITPTEPEDAEAGTTETIPAAADRRFYQLTHDYLVPSLRDWLTRKQKETRRGRAQLRMVERSALWHAKPENRNLPSWWEYLNIRLFTKRRAWSKPQRKMMRRACRIHATRWTIATLVLLALGIAFQQLWSRNLGQRIKTAVTAMSTSDGNAVPWAIEALAEFPRQRVADALDCSYRNVDDERKLSLAYARAAYDRVDCNFLVDAVADAPGQECDNIVTALKNERELAVEYLQRAATHASEDQDWKLKTRLATAALHLGDPSIAADMLRAAPPALEPKPDWQDLPLEPGWNQVDDATRAAITAAHGMLEERFAFCLDMPWETFLATIETLRPSGYRPTRVRPFLQGNERLVAAVWTRDGKRCQLDHDRTAEQLSSGHTPATRKGWVPVDLATYLGDGDTTLYCLLWSQPNAENEQRRLRVGITQLGWDAAVAKMREAGLSTQVTLQAFLSASGTRQYAGIWSSAGDKSQANPTMEQPKTGWHEVIWTDISVAAPGELPHPSDVLRQRLDVLAEMPPAYQESPEVRLERAKAHYYLDQTRDALEDLDYLMAESPPMAEAVLFCALCRAQLGKTQEADEALTVLLATYGVTSYAAVGQILTRAWLGKIGEAGGGFDFLEQQHAYDSMEIYDTACVAAQLSRICTDIESSVVAVWNERALKLIRSAYARGYRGNTGINNDPDFIPLWGAPDFQRLLREFAGDRCYAGVWRSSDQAESWVDANLSLDEQQEAARQHAASDFRPMAVAVTVLPDELEPRTVVVWQRPKVVPPPWDPVQRTTFIEWFPKWPGRLEKLPTFVDAAHDTSLKSGISLALGSITEASTEAKRAWGPVLTDWHSRHPDSGVHSAARWALRSWGLSPPQIESTDEAREGFNWRVTKTGLTLIRIPAGRVELPASSEQGDDRKTIRIDKEFWLSDREVTAGQFLAFLDDEEVEKPTEPDEIRQYNQGTPRQPVVYVSWYDAVMFCNWLSRQEGRDACYRKEGKERFPDYRDRTVEYDAWKLIPGTNGYRLPTADEWEYACRARTTTQYSCGDDEDLLTRYAIFLKNAKGGPACVGTKLCNAWGLFDMHGNVWEWSQDWDGFITLRRGGSWDDSAVSTRGVPYVHVIDRFQRDHTLGFRVAVVPSASPASGAESGSR